MIELILIVIGGYAVVVIASRSKPIRTAPIKAPIESLERPRDSTELWVESELKKKLPQKGYVVFGNLIIPSVSKEIRSTQIDHVIISPFGIFCLETKSHQGNIYGNEKQKYWKQFLGTKTYDLYNPLRQNSHHVRSLEYLLRSRLKSPIHSYIVFPSAHNVKLGGERVDLTLGHTIERIIKHKRHIYGPADIEAISKGLAYVSSRTGDYNEAHINQVKAYISKHN